MACDGSIASPIDGRSLTRESEAIAVVRLPGTSQLGVLLMSTLTAPFSLLCIVPVTKPVRTTVLGDLEAGVHAEITVMAHRAR
jgi:hypothetical protein